ncbi:MAG: YibE/F family protein [Dehalococcoidia bacterium]
MRSWRPRIRGIAASPGRFASYATAAVLVVLFGWVIPALGLWPSAGLPLAERDLREARVVQVIEQTTTTAVDGEIVVERVALNLDGRRIEADRVYVRGSANGFELHEGDAIMVFVTRSSSGVSYQIADQSRRIPVWVLGAAFVAFVVIVGGRQGVLSLAGLLSTVIVIWQFILPAILGGASPLLICIVGATVIMAVTLIVGHGGGRTSMVALAATATCLVLAGLLASWAVAFATLTGAASEESATLLRLTGGAIDMRGLLLGAMIIGAVGVLDDVTTTQASTVFQLHDADRTLSRYELFRRAMRVGRDHIAATTNTLLLAYAGAALPLLLLLAAQNLSIGVVSFETFTTEVVRTVVGSMAIVAAVPVASAVATLVVRPEDAP